MIDQLSDSIAELNAATDARFARDAAEIQRLREANAELVSACKAALPVVMCALKDHASMNEGRAAPFQANALRKLEAALAATEPSPITLPPTAQDYAASHDDAGDELAVWERPDRFEQE